MTRSYVVEVLVDVTPDHQNVAIANLDITGFMVGSKIIPFSPNISVELRDAIEREAQYQASEDDWSDDDLS